MCRNITVLRGLQPPATAEETRAAARQYVRKVSGSATKPPVGFEQRFDERGWMAITAITSDLLPMSCRLGVSRRRRCRLMRRHWGGP